MEIKSLYQSGLLKNVSILASGTALAQLIPIALQPFMRRQFSAEIYGAYSVYLSLLGILIVVSSFKYELAIILPKKKKEAANVFFLAGLISFLVNIILLFSVLIWKTELANFLNLSVKYSNYLYFVPLGTFLFNFYQSINYWLIREKKFMAISKNKFIRRGAEGVSQLGFSFSIKQFGLIYGDLIGHFFNNVSGIFQAYKSGLKTKLLSLAKLKYVANKYKEYPRLNLLPSFMSACSYLLPVLFINKFYSSAYTGYFDLSKLVLSIPLALVATSISSVLLQRISEKFKNNESLIKELAPIILIAIIIAAGEIIVISLFGKELFGLFFGKKNAYSGEISQILVWSFALNFITATFSSIFIGMKKIKYLSLWQVIYFIGIVSLILFKNVSFTLFIERYVLIEVFCALLSIIFMVGIIYNYELGLRKRTV